jgi:hypothetical protein
MWEIIDCYYKQQVTHPLQRNPYIVLKFMYIFLVTLSPVRASQRPASDSVLSQVGSD